MPPHSRQRTELAEPQAPGARVPVSGGPLALGALPHGHLVGLRGMVRVEKQRVRGHDLSPCHADGALLRIHDVLRVLGRLLAENEDCAVPALLDDRLVVGPAGDAAITAGVEDVGGWHLALDAVALVEGGVVRSAAGGASAFASAFAGPLRGGFCPSFLECLRFLDVLQRFAVVQHLAILAGPGVRNVALLVLEHLAMQHSLLLRLSLDSHLPVRQHHLLHLRGPLQALREALPRGALHRLDRVARVRLGSLLRDIRARRGRHVRLFDGPARLVVLGIILLVLALLGNGLVLDLVLPTDAPAPPGRGSGRVLLLLKDLPGDLRWQSAREEDAHLETRARAGFVSLVEADGPLRLHTAVVGAEDADPVVGADAAALWVDAAVPLSINEELKALRPPLANCHDALEAIQPGAPLHLVRLPVVPSAHNVVGLWSHVRLIDPLQVVDGHDRGLLPAMYHHGEPALAGGLDQRAN
mmetsp:Transcript_38131/g.118959  ORF Transcript_38131/g.118959 Transcript_38131/m.118959 type:complete len:470 (-) Transcript_38131:187-1596(-)